MFQRKSLSGKLFWRGMYDFLKQVHASVDSAFPCLEDKEAGKGLGKDGQAPVMGF